MFRKFLSAAFVLAVVVSVVVGDEFMAGIRKVEGDKVTFNKFKKGEGDKKFDIGPEETLPAADNVKVVNGRPMKGDGKFVIEAGDPLEGGLKNERFKNIEKGVPAWVVTDGGKITEIRVLKGFGKKKDQ